LARNHNCTIVVVGLGRFGRALAEQLYDEGHDVMGIDIDEAVIKACTEILTFAEVGDATDEQTMTQLGVADSGHGVVGIGDSIQASILATATLSDIGVPDIWAKAMTQQHRRILERVGANHIIFPETDAGRRVAHRISSSVDDYIELDPGFVMAEVVVPARFVGMTAEAADIPHSHSVTAICHNPPGGSFALTTNDTEFVEGDLLLVAGSVDSVGRFAKLAQQRP